MDGAAMIFKIYNFHTMCGPKGCVNFEALTVIKTKDAAGEVSHGVENILVIISIVSTD